MDDPRDTSFDALVMRLAETMREAERLDLALGAAWCAMQLVGGPEAAVVVRAYCAVSAERSCR